jgi:CheY-like chemotaxis protein
MVQEEHFDLVFMDVQMPEMDGYAATGAIREWEKSQGRHIPIIAMTANAMKGDRQLCLDMGMDGYVAKPINQEEVQSAMQQVIRDLADNQVTDSGRIVQ